MSETHGRWLWYELVTPDLAAAEQFYVDVVGWTTTPFEGSPTGPYTMFVRPDGVPEAGAMTLLDDLAATGVPPHWMAYVGVTALEPAVANVVRHGGASISPVFDVPTVGRMQTIRDPQGAVISLLEPVTASQAGDSPAPVGGVSWVELMTTDAEAALKFYGAVFGWVRTESMDMGGGVTYHMFGRRADHSVGGVMAFTPDMTGMPPNWGLYFRVPDLEAAVARATARGAQVLNGPMDVPGDSRIVNMLDPQGAAFSLHTQNG
jgi:uncharacterized protein